LNNITVFLICINGEGTILLEKFVASVLVKKISKKIDFQRKSLIYVIMNIDITSKLDNEIFVQHFVVF
ncbi:hypothetical protein, partial [Tetragenococcus muriaticus]|uniref:hypothetical protein n=1 Tax=Tetragenococcus muriaticus TaxID=64642 RepID=UPI001E2B8881